ncbi:MAG: hypothetical protein OXE05_07905 [Chloroflexi bacterium]|nr:hypothetical protein [Chloroflexota bacterium]
MDSFEQAFSDTEKAADSALKSANDLTKQVKALQKAAKDGNITAIKNSCQNLDSVLALLRQEVANAVRTWPYTDEEEVMYLENGYFDELRQATEEKGLDTFEQDGRLISPPSVVRVLPGDRAVRVDRKKISTLRPSHLAEMLVKNSKKPPRFRADAFLESLHKTYALVSGEQSPKQLMPSRSGPAVPLAKIYEALTLLPGVSLHYMDKTDFARGIYVLETQGPFRTKKGARVSFPASTGTKSGRSTFQFVGPEGQVIRYYAIQFIGGD